jgi:hypothetical protein
MAPNARRSARVSAPQRLRFLAAARRNLAGLVSDKETLLPPERVTRSASDGFSQST